MSNSNNNTATNTYQSESILQKRVRNFKKIKRAYYSLLAIGIAYLLSFFAPLLVNNKAIVVKHNGSFYFPAIGDLLGEGFVSHHEASFFGQEEVFGEKRYGEPHYRELQRQYKAENSGNWVMMPLYPYSPVENLLSELKGNPPTAPDSQHILGTDNRGRDVFARVIYGFQISISFALIVTLLSYIMGIIIGGTLGYYGNKVDLYGLRFIEIFSLLPFLFIIIILSSFIKPSFFTLILLLVLLRGWIGITYYVRGEFFREKARDYTAAAIAMGASTPSVMFKHILPNALTSVITFAPFALISNIGTLIALDFLGFGLRPPTPSWGELISQGVSEDISYWWLIVTPLFMIFITLTTITFIGEGVRQAFDPREYSKLQ